MSDYSIDFSKGCEFCGPTAATARLFYSTMHGKVMCDNIPHCNKRRRRARERGRPQPTKTN